MKHLFVPYEIAVRLKEKGFNEHCFMFYYNDGEGLTDDVIFKTGTDSNPCNAPIYHQVTDWLFKKGFHLHRYYLSDEKKWGCDVYSNEDCYLFWSSTLMSSNSETETQALDKAIEEALKLIA